MTPSEEKQVEFQRAMAEAMALEAIAHFSMVVAKGAATPEDMAFMTKVADLLDESRMREVKRIARKGLASNSEILSSL